MLEEISDVRLPHCSWPLRATYAPFPYLAMMELVVWYDIRPADHVYSEPPVVLPGSGTVFKTKIWIQTTAPQT